MPDMPRYRSEPPYNDATLQDLLHDIHNHPHASAVGRVVWQALITSPRQDLDGPLITRPALVQSLSTQSRVHYEDARLGNANVFDVMLRGVQSMQDHALINAFAMEGFVAEAAETIDSKAQSELAKHFVQQAERIDAYARVSLYPLITDALHPGVRAHIFARLAAKLADQQTLITNPHRHQAQQGTRLGALLYLNQLAPRDNAESPAWLERARAQLVEWFAQQQQQQAQPTYTLKGQSIALPRRLLSFIPRWLTGWGLLTWFMRGVVWLAGLRHRSQIKLEASHLAITRHTTFAKQSIRQKHQCYSLQSLSLVARYRRYPALPLFVGFTAFTVGVFVGALWLFEGIIGGDAWVLLAGSGLMLLGILVDFVLALWYPQQRAKTRLRFVFSNRDEYLLNIDKNTALESFLNALEARWQHTEPNKGATDAAHAKQEAPLETQATLVDRLETDARPPSVPPPSAVVGSEGRYFQIPSPPPPEIEYSQASHSEEPTPSGNDTLRQSDAPSHPSTQDDNDKV